MKYLKRYNPFLEEAEFDIQTTDEPDIKMSKEKLNSLIGYIKEFKSKKNSIDLIYTKTDNDVDLKKKIEQLTGPEVSSKKDRNPFIVEYLNVSEMKRRMDKIRKELVDDKIKLDDFNEELKNATDSTQKVSINQKISDINKRMGLSNTSISKLKSDITKYEKELNDRMLKSEKEMKDYIKKISNKKVK